MKMSKYPENEKIDTKHKSAIEEFIDWFDSQYSVVPRGKNPEKLYCEFMDLDHEKIQAEREQMFKDLRGES